MSKLLTSALLVLATCLFLPATSTASTNNTFQKDKDLISKSREGDVLKHSADKILISETRDGDVMKEESALPQ